MNEQLFIFCTPAAPPRTQALAAAGIDGRQGAASGDAREQASAAMDTALSGAGSQRRALSDGEFRSGGYESAGMVADMAGDLLRRPREMGRLTC